MTSYQDISDAKTEKALLDLLSDVVDVNRHSILVESLKDNPERFYVDSRSAMPSAQQRKLDAIAKRLVVLRSQ